VAATGTDGAVVKMPLPSGTESCGSLVRLPVAATGRDAGGAVAELPLHSSAWCCGSLVKATLGFPTFPDDVVGVDGINCWAGRGGSGGEVVMGLSVGEIVGVAVWDEVDPAWASSSKLMTCVPGGNVVLTFAFFRL
jgi:hypothetical protein